MIINKSSPKLATFLPLLTRNLTVVGDVLKLYVENTPLLSKQAMLVTNCTALTRTEAKNSCCNDGKENG